MSLARISFERAWERDTSLKRLSPQHAKPIAMIRSRPNVTPLRLSKGSLICALITIINTQVASPKNAFNPTVTPHAMNALLRHRAERTDTVVQRPSNRTPTTRTTAAQISEKSSMSSVVEPIARRTRQNITGTIDIYDYLSFCNAGIQSIRGTIQLTTLQV